MTDRKTLKLGEATEAPALKKRGRGWEISDKRLDNLHDQARHMRRHSSAAHKALAARFAKADLGRYKFTCHNLGMAIAIDEEGADETLARRRDKSLESVGVRVMRIKAADVLGNIDDVLARITAGMRMRIGDRKDAARAHAQANPKQDYSRPNRAPHGKTNAENR